MNDIRSIRGGRRDASAGLHAREALTPYLDALASTLKRVQNEVSDLDSLVKYVTRLTGSAVQAMRLFTQLGDKGSTDALAKLESMLADAERLNPGSITKRHAESIRKDVA